MGTAFVIQADFRVLERIRSPDSFVKIERDYFVFGGQIEQDNIRWSSMNSLHVHRIYSKCRYMSRTLPEVVAEEVFRELFTEQCSVFIKHHSALVAVECF